MRRWEGPNDEEQGGAIDRLATRGPLFLRVASTETSSSNAHPTRRSDSPGHSSRAESKGLPAHVQDNRRRRGTDECVACRTRHVKHEDSLGRACSTSSNRLMRTRMPGGVGRVTGNGGPYPIIWRLVRLVSSVRPMIDAAETSYLAIVSGRDPA